MTQSNPSSPTQDRSIEAKQRILSAALELFANKGFDKTSTREIALNAKVNLSAIKYYFNDKQSLYNHVYQNHRTPSDNQNKSYQYFDNLNDQLEHIFDLMLDCFDNKKFQLARKIQMREQLDPTGLWLSHIENDIKPKHNHLVTLILQQIPNMPKDQAHRLTFSIISLFIGVFVNQDVISNISPQLINDKNNIKLWKEKMIQYAQNMIKIEQNIYKDTI